jgi:hypothetical protein
MFVHHCHRHSNLKFVMPLMYIACLSAIVFFFVNKFPNSIPIIVRSNTMFSKVFKIKCHPFTVPDSRSFFEREPSQLNLPRWLSYSSPQDLLHQLRSLRLIAVSCARNVEKSIDKFRNHIESIVDLFHPSSRILILESDSTDNTLAKLYEWPRAQVYTYGILSRLYRDRTERLAYCRNKLLQKAQELGADYMLVTDIDIFAGNTASFVSNFRYNVDDWTVMTATGSKAYYDIWALRTLSDSILNFDVWRQVSSIQRSSIFYCSQSVVDQIIGNNQKSIPISHGLTEVRSAFNGAGLYKINATYGCKYSGKNSTCEHVPFHLCIREKKQGRIFINPNFLID